MSLAWHHILWWRWYIKRGGETQCQFLRVVCTSRSGPLISMISKVVSCYSSQPILLVIGAIGCMLQVVGGSNSLKGKMLISYTGYLLSLSPLCLFTDIYILGDYNSSSTVHWVAAVFKCYDLHRCFTFYLCLLCLVCLLLTGIGVRCVIYTCFFSSQWVFFQEEVFTAGIFLLGVFL